MKRGDQTLFEVGIEFFTDDPGASVSWVWDVADEEALGDETHERFEKARQAFVDAWMERDPDA